MAARSPGRTRRRVGRGRTAATATNSGWKRGIPRITDRASSGGRFPSGHDSPLDATTTSAPPLPLWRNTTATEAPQRVLFRDGNVTVARPVIGAIRRGQDVV